MSINVQATPGTAEVSVTHSAPNHSVGIEPMTVGLGNGGAMHNNARAAVVERYNGQLIQIITTDNDDFRRAPMEEIAVFYALWANASVAPAIWPTCPHCGAPDNECPDLFTHLRWSADHEGSRR